MRLHRFDYHSPADIASACRLLAELQGAAVLAGGTDLLVDLKEETVVWDHLVSLKKIEALRAISFDKQSGLLIGAAATHTQIARDETIRELYPGLAEAAGSVAAVQIRNRGTVGGNICSAVPSADVPPILLAMGAELRLESVDGQRRVPISDFFVGPRKTNLRDKEILVSIHIPPPEGNSGSCYLKFALRGASALAVVGVVAYIVTDGEVCVDGRIALGAVAPTPIIASKAGELLRGIAVDETVAGKAGFVAGKECKPISDIRGSADFRRELVETLTRRAVLEAFRRALGFERD
jgi:carbon-monoxide dehydrogenase medium subunit